VVEFAPEDWQFSRECHRVGATIAVTRKVHARHVGRKEYTCDELYDGDIDDEAIEFHASKPLAIRTKE
jgi:hypothetical protein